MTQKDDHNGDNEEYNVEQEDIVGEDNDDDDDEREDDDNDSSKKMTLAMKEMMIANYQEKRILVAYYKWEYNEADYSNSDIQGKG